MISRISKVEYKAIPWWIPLVIKDRWEALRERMETLKVEYRPKRGWLDDRRKDD